MAFVFYFSTKINNFTSPLHVATHFWQKLLFWCIYLNHKHFNMLHQCSFFLLLLILHYCIFCISEVKFVTMDSYNNSAHDCNVMLVYCFSRIIRLMSACAVTLYTLYKLLRNNQMITSQVSIAYMSRWWSKIYNYKLFAV